MFGNGSIIFAQLAWDVAGSVPNMPKGMGANPIIRFCYIWSVTVFEGTIAIHTEEKIVLILRYLYYNMI